MADTAEVFVQWKGTEVCLDLHCGCGYDGHLDDSFAYGLQCGGCERVYEMPHTFQVTAGEYGGTIREAYDWAKHPPRGDGVQEVAVVVPTAFEMQEERDEYRRQRDEQRARVAELERQRDAVLALCDEAERDEPETVFSQGGPMWSIWTADIRKAYGGGE